MEEKKEDNKIVQVRLPDAVVKKIDGLIKAGWYKSRSEYIKEKVRVSLRL